MEDWCCQADQSKFVTSQQMEIVFFTPWVRSSSGGTQRPGKQPILLQLDSSIQAQGGVRSSSSGLGPPVK